MSAPHSNAGSGDVLDAALASAHGLLPDQGPIGVFVHHNTLHALQHLPFEEAVPKGAAMLGARAWPDIELLRAAWRNGRIEERDVEPVLDEALEGRGEEPLPLGLSRRALWRTLLHESVESDDAAGIAFVHGEEPLFEAALGKVTPGVKTVRAPRRHRDVLVARGATDTDEAVHSELIRLGIAFLDLGQARNRLPERQEGFLRAAAHVLTTGGARPSALGPVCADFERILQQNLSARSVVRETLLALGVGDADLQDFVLATALALPGVTGMFARLERHPEEGDAPATLLDVLAVRFVIERRAIERAAADAGLPCTWGELKARMPGPTARPRECEALLLAALARAAGKSADALRSLSDAEVSTLLHEATALPLERRNFLLFLAFENAYRRRILTGMAVLRNKTEAAPRTPMRPKAQVMFCIDEREESIRRALEELDPAIQTLGAAGFFGMAIDFMGLDDHATAPYCPVVVKPAHEVHESAVAHEQQWQGLRGRLLASWHAVERTVAMASRTLLGGAVASGLGPLAFALAQGRVSAPRASMRLWGGLTASVVRMPETELHSLRSKTIGTPSSTSEKPLGFSIDEAADRVTAMLKNVGLTRDQARLIVVLGHGSSSLNNPHESAHDCGACGGRRGGANARLFAEFANRPDVRAAVQARGVSLPEDTWFIGGLHDTASDAVELYDLAELPASHHQEFAALHATLEQARKESARERCRRFLHAPLGLSAEAALAHVEERATHLGQPRPEYGHCTNAMAIVGRRTLTRGLHLDRRPFLVSYDPTIDENDVILERVLAAVGPVGAGINLEYFFSSVDNEVYGCGTKLPHNVTGLLGVMNGHQGDLRTGLPLQMVELHEPMRLLLIVEASPESLLTVAGRQAEVRELVLNRWVHLVSVHPKTGAITCFQQGRFVPFVPTDAALPEFERSHDWHGKSRDFVAPALINASLKSPLST
ncbi:MAG TPA: putative inorganic carbon transporter subunit DabA [Archangium sp.]|jgi:hypothetical protein|uniref:putative inorganic carbon transporter subunit DabA n=1 Tax=Archangium sp. TaxID=1872627 RepID=UPI002ED78A92